MSSADSTTCGGSGECLFAVRRCALDFAIECPTGEATPCPASSDCLFSMAQFVELSQALEVLATSPPSADTGPYMVRVPFGFPT